MAADGVLVLPGFPTPRLGRDVFVAPGAVVLGDVVLGDEVSVWFGAVVRGDIGPIRVGARTNLQDLTLVHLTEGVSTTTLGADVTVGHRVVLHGCTVGDRCLIGMGAILLDGCEIGEESLVAAGTLVPPRAKVPPRSLVRGAPGRVVREVTDDERRMGVEGARHYVDNARRFRAALAAREVTT